MFGLKIEILKKSLFTVFFQTFGYEKSLKLNETQNQSALLFY
jgi:hypothetical protein